MAAPDSTTECDGTAEYDGVPGQAGSPWRRVDFTPAGMVVPDRGAGDKAECRGWLQYAAQAHRGQAYLHWAQLTGIGEFIDIALADLDDAVCAGEDQRDLFDPYTLAVTEVAVVFAIPNAAATRLVGEAVAMSERLPKTAELLREGTISPAMFTSVVARTDVVEERALVDAVDADLAAQLAAAGHVSQKKVEDIADRIVNRHDRDAVRRKAEKAKRRKNVSQRDYPDGLGGLSITADKEETVLAIQAVNAAIAGCCGNDSRTLGQRRSAYAIARLRQLPFTCGCTDKDTCTATLSEDAISERQARIVVHAVCQKSTLTGDDDEPGYLDGTGPISAEQVRDIAARPDAIVRDLDLDALTAVAAPADTPTADAPTADTPTADAPTADTPTADTPTRASGNAACVAGTDAVVGAAADPASDAPNDAPRGAEEAGSPALIVNTSQPADPYRPTAALDALVRSLFGTCTVAGCERPAWNCELDHVEEFASRSFTAGNPLCPASGGPTCLCNVSPKCVMHHQLKTFLGASSPEDGWLDEQWIADDGAVWTSTTTAHGVTVDTRAANQWLFPQLSQLQCLHQTHAPPEPEPEPVPVSGRSTGPDGCLPGAGLRAATAHKHAWRRAARARLRAARKRAENSGGPPPF